MAGHVGADLGRILAPTFGQRAGTVFQARFGGLGFGVTEQDQAAHGLLYGVQGYRRGQRAAKVANRVNMSKGDTTAAKLVRRGDKVVAKAGAAAG